MTKILIDSNILVYAVDVSELEKHGSSNKLLLDLAETGNAVLSSQNLAEFSRALEKSKAVSYDQIKLFVSYLASVFQTVNYNSDSVLKALDISSQYSIHFFDALLAATMEENFISEIITENEKDFKKIPWLKVTNPF